MTKEEKQKRLSRHPALIKCDLTVIKNEVVKLNSNCKDIEGIEPLTGEVIELLNKIEVLIYEGDNDIKR